MPDQPPLRRLRRSAWLLLTFVAAAAGGVFAPAAHAAGTTPTPPLRQGAGGVAEARAVEELYRAVRADFATPAAAERHPAGGGELVPHPLGGRYRVASGEEQAVMVAVQGAGGRLAATCSHAAAREADLTAQAAAAVSAASSLSAVLLRRDELRLRGTDPEGRPYLWAPDPPVSGSSISHWDPAVSPDLLMEPTLFTGAAHHDVDLTEPALRDLGWRPGSFTARLESANNHQAGMQDPRPFAGAPGNPAATLGEARTRALRFALEQWGARLGSNVPVEVVVLFRPLTCRPGVGATLGAAGARFFFADVPGLPLAGTQYPAALAEALAGQPLNRGVTPIGAGEDVLVNLNGDLDEGCLGEGRGWYYGLDGNPGPGQFDFVTVVLHELAHAFGMANRTDEPSGARTGASVLPTPWDHLTLDTATGASWADLDQEGRAASARRTRRVVFAGPATREAAPAELTGGTDLVELGAGAAAEIMVAAGADFGPALDSDGVRAGLACFVDDEPAPTRLDGCSAPRAAGSLAGRIALVERGGACDVTTKVSFAEAAGAVAVVVVDAATDAPRAPTGGVAAVPVVAVGRGDGRRLQRAVCDEVVRLRTGRFEVSAQWEMGAASGIARGGTITDSAAYLTFFTPDNVELVVKVLDGCSADGSGHHWVFASGLTNAGVVLSVSDLATGAVWRHRHAPGAPFPPVFATNALACH
jgi:hypothetical protein